MSDSDSTILCCPACDSNRAGILASVPPKAKCADCGKIYPIVTLPDPVGGNGKKGKKPRTAAPGVRHRRDNGPVEFQVSAVPPPTPDQLGTTTALTHTLISGGPADMIKAVHEAAKLSKKFGEEFEAKWLLPTAWLYKLGARNRARARYALVWRPRFLAVLALSRSIILACRSAKVSRPTVDAHRKQDPDFEAQCLAAEEHAVELLHDVAFRRALEGDCEPIFWQGIQVGHVKKYDGRLQVELLRAHLPKKFKTPGTGAPLVAGDNNQVLVMDAATIQKIQAARREALEAMNPPKVLTDTAPNGAVQDSGNSSGAVQ
jgi:hypothetical protein